MSEVQINAYSNASPYPVAFIYTGFFSALGFVPANNGTPVVVGGGLEGSGFHLPDSSTSPVYVFFYQGGSPPFGGSTEVWMVYGSTGGTVYTASSPSSPFQATINVADSFNVNLTISAGGTFVISDAGN